MGRPEQLISRAIELLHKARFMLDQTVAGDAVAAVERALTAAAFARAPALQAEAIAASVAKPKRPRLRPYVTEISRVFWSERRDLNSRPLVPQTSALTGLRYAPTLK